MATEERPGKLTSAVFAILIIGLLIIGSFWVLQPFLPALIWAAMIVISTWRIMLLVQAKLKGSRSLAVLVMTGILLLVLVLPLTVAFTSIVENVDGVNEKAQQLISEGLPPAPAWLSEFPVVGAKLAARWEKMASLSRDEALTKLAPFVGTALTWLVDQIGGVGRLMVHFLLTIIFAAILYSRGEIWGGGIIRFARRLAQDRGENAVVLASQAVRAVANGVVITAVIQSIMTGVGLLLAGVPYTLVLTCVAFLLGVVQIGAAPVVIGALIWLFNTGQTFTAWVFLAWAIVVLLSDNFIRPFLIKRGADLPLLLIFAGVVGGLISFGVIGLFIGPVVLAVSYTLLNAWIADAEAPGAGT